MQTRVRHSRYVAMLSLVLTKRRFCWVCMGPWSEHGTQWYNCNRFDDKSAVEARDAQSKSRISLERYLHVGLPLPFCLCLLNLAFPVLQPLGKSRTISSTLS